MEIERYQFNQADNSMLDEIYGIYLRTRATLFENGILQWDNLYPSREYFQECIHEGTMYVLIEDNIILGHVVLNESQTEEWRNIPWEGSHPIVIHSLMIDPEIQGKGLGSDFVRTCECFSKERGYSSVRLDAFSENEKALHLYSKLGYQQRDSVFFSSKPEGHQEYICFEKNL